MSTASFILRPNGGWTAAWFYQRGLLLLALRGRNLGIPIKEIAREVHMGVFCPEGAPFWVGKPLIFMGCTHMGHLATGFGGARNEHPNQNAELIQSSPGQPSPTHSSPAHSHHSMAYLLPRLPSRWAVGMAYGVLWHFLSRSGAGHRLQ